jgi:hypothetical protein
MSIVSAVVLLAQGNPDSCARRFDELGFRAEVVSPNGLTISGEEQLFTRTFGVKLSLGDDGVWVVTDGKRSRTVPKAKLPATLRVQVEAIEFEAPPDFGPSKF